MRVKNSTNPFFTMFERKKDTSQRGPFWNWRTNSKFAPNRGSAKGCIHEPNWFWLAWVSTTEKLLEFIKKRDGYFLFSDYPSGGRGPTNKRISLSSLLFIYNLHDKTIKKRFLINCFKSILPEKFFKYLLLQKIAFDKSVKGF